MGVGADLVLHLASLLLEGDEWVCIILPWDELVLIKLLLLYGVEDYNVLVFVLVEHGSPGFRIAEESDIGGAASQIVKHIGNL